MVTGKIMGGLGWVTSRLCNGAHTPDFKPVVEIARSDQGSVGKKERERARDLAF